MAGPLEANEGEQPHFAQLYVHDPALQTSMRFENMSLPVSISDRQKHVLAEILETVQQELRDNNPFVKDFLQIKEIPEEQIGLGKIVISAKN